MTEKTGIEMMLWSIAVSDFAKEKVREIVAKGMYDNDRRGCDCTGQRCCRSCVKSVAMSISILDELSHRLESDEDDGVIMDALIGTYEAEVDLFLSKFLSDDVVLRISVDGIEFMRTVKE